MNNQTLVLISGILQTLAVVARSPSFGVVSTDYADLLDLAARLIQRGDDAVAELESLKREVDELLAHKSKPTAERIESWRRRSDAAHAELQSLKSSSSSTSD
jgi:hypothetical protein